MVLPRVLIGRQKCKRSTMVSTSIICLASLALLALLVASHIELADAGRRGGGGSRSRGSSSSGGRYVTQNKMNTGILIRKILQNKDYQL